MESRTRQWMVVGYDSTTMDLVPMFTEDNEVSSFETEREAIEAANKMQPRFKSLTLHACEVVPHADEDSQNE